MTLRDTSPDIALSQEQQNRMRDIVRRIPEDVKLFVIAVAKTASDLVDDDVLTEQGAAYDAGVDGNQFLKKTIDELTQRLQGAFTNLPYTTGALTRQLQLSKHQLAARAFERGNTEEDAAFYAGISPLYSRLCEILEQQILFAPEQFVDHPRRGRVH